MSTEAAEGGTRETASICSGGKPPRTEASKPVIAARNAVRLAGAHGHPPQPAGTYLEAGALGAGNTQNGDTSWGDVGTRSSSMLRSQRE